MIRKELKKILDIENEVITPGRYVKALRQSFHITQKELEELTGIQNTNLSAIENDKKEIGVKTAKILAAALGVDPQNILFPLSARALPEEKELSKIRAKGEKLRQSKFTS
jgi:transcriptional regulator with XRE-family HTH domain